MNRKIFYIALFLLFIQSCNLFGPDEPDTTDNKLYVFSNLSQKFYLIDYKTFEVVKEIPLRVPEGVSLRSLELSTDRDFLFLSTGAQNDSAISFARYNILEERFEELYHSGLFAHGPVRFSAGLEKDNPGLILAHLRDGPDGGLFRIDLFEEKIVNKVSDESSFLLDRAFGHSNSVRWTVIQQNWFGDGLGYSELKFYKQGSGLSDYEFTLNDKGRDSISVYDFTFSEDDARLFITYQLSGGRSRDIESYLGYYDLETKELVQKELVFPWSLNPYYMAYSKSRDEIYTIGAYQALHIVDSNTFERKELIVLLDKVNGSSLIKLSPDEKYAFISASNSGLIFVIDLDERELIAKIALERPYFMIIP